MKNGVENPASRSAIPQKNCRVDVANMPFDLVSKDLVEAEIRDRPASQPFEYVVTPNVDHIVRNHRTNVRWLYDDAWLSVCDSRILGRLAPIIGIQFPSIITGSDLTKTILERFVKEGDAISIVGCEDQHIAVLRSKMPGVVIHHINPPMGFIKVPAEVEKVVEFVVKHPSRYVFLAVGNPQQEIVARAMKEQGATGIGLCIGASILFVTGAEKRAPKWIQDINMEWLYRLLQNPRRLWRRYLVDDPMIFSLIVRQRLGLLGGKEK